MTKGPKLPDFLTLAPPAAIAIVSGELTDMPMLGISFESPKLRAKVRDFMESGSVFTTMVDYQGYQLETDADVREAMMMLILDLARNHDISTLLKSWSGYLEHLPTNMLQPAIDYPLQPEGLDLAGLIVLYNHYVDPKRTIGQLFTALRDLGWQIAAENPDGPEFSMVAKPIPDQWCK